MNILIMPLKKNEGINLARALETYGHKVSCNGITISKAHPLIKILSVPFHFIKEFKKHDVIILEAITFDVINAILLSKLNKIPLIIYSKGFFPGELENFKPKLLSFLLYFLNKYSYENSTHIVYISKWLKDKYLKESKLEISNKSYSIIHHSIDPLFIINEINSFINKNEINLCYTSDFYFYEKTKGGLLVINAFSYIEKKYPNINLIIIGDGRYKYLLEEKVSNLKLNGRVIFTGRIMKEELKHYYQSSYLFVYSSFLDACPTVVMEAQVSGIPVIVTKGSGAMELVVDGVTGIICKCTIDSLVDSLTYLIENPEIRNMMAIHAKDHIEKKLLWINTAEKFNEIISNCEKIKYNYY